ncbi:nuclear transport factor 2 family protein [Mycolicibacterium flavescens]|uniref:Polyketide cyclase n=1 Tax=Mycolicibacterium flavescens TaxID=1776 RepID=A0A1E3RHC1_MYCFV|nr:nuclear transport factor 2 family protein [Mycolicibacterium flavescens]MCV7280165.1 nuclear transport factor 2 family protein [Mycolicibacterium flavescens]ODQ89268.1 polyketide cyclase [Mycolicibacterium flavescens]
MTDRTEVEQAFRHYYMTGPVLEDWAAWGRLFTDDAKYFDHYYGTFTGPEEVARFLEGTMAASPMVYSVLKWYVIDGTRVVYQCLNRADNPEPGQPPIDFPSTQIIDYAGDGKWEREEDIWLMGEMKVFAQRYAEADQRFPQTLEQKLRRDDWGDWVEWARPEPGHQARPSWYGKPDFKPLRRLADFDFGVRSH